MAGLASSRVTLRRETAPELVEAQARPGWAEQIGAGFRMTQDDVASVQEKRRFDAYQELERELIGLGEQPDALRHKPINGLGWLGVPDAPLSSRIPDTDAIWAAAMRRRASDPSLFKSLPTTQKEFEAWALNRRGGRARDQRVADDGGSLTASLVGGIAGGFTDPFNVLTLPIGGGGKTVASVALREGLLNAGLELFQQPELKASREARGEQLTVGEAAANVGMAGLGGAALGGGGKFIWDNRGSIAALPKAAQEAIWAKVAPLIPEGMRPSITGFDDIPDSLLPTIARGLLGEDGMDGDMRAAAASLERAAMDDADLPFLPTQRAKDVHVDLLAKAMQDALDGLPPSSRPMIRPPADLRAGTAIGSGTIGATPARDALKLRIGRVESGGNDASANPRSSALGKYQFTRGTWLALFKRRFGDMGLADDAIAAKRGNGALQDLLMDDLLDANARALSRAGQAETAGNLYLAHFAGSDGAVRLLEADGRATAQSVLGADVVRANPFLKSMTAADVVAWAHRKMGEATPARADARLALAGDDAALQSVLDGLDAEAARLDAELLRADGDPDAASPARVEAAMGQDARPASSLRLDDPPEAAPTLRLPDALQAAPEPPRLSPEAVAIIPAVRTAIDDPARPSLNPAKLAKALGAKEPDVFAALSELVRQGAGVFQTAGRRAIVKEGEAATAIRFQRHPQARGPVDALTFIARAGGVRDGVEDGVWDGFGPNLGKGFVNRQTGRFHAGREIDRFVPGAGPLLRRGGRSLDELGELLHEAGYLRTRDADNLARGDARPTGDEVEQFLVDLVENKRKVYPADQDAIARAIEDEAEAAAQADEFAHHLETAAERWGLELDADDRALAQQLFTGDFEETLLEMMNLRANEARVDAYIEADGDAGDAYQWEAAFDAGPDAGQRSARGIDGRSVDGRNPDEGGADAQEFRDAEFARLGLDRLSEDESLAAFAEADGPGVDAQIESIGHDLDMAFNPPPRPVDPNIADRQRQEARLRADAPLQGGAKTGQAQDGTMGLGLFDAVDQPGFRLEGDGRPKSYDAIMKALDTEDAEIAAARACAQPKGAEK
jgi:hypothetical protein